MIRLVVWLDGPIDARGEIVLIGFTPTPDRGVVAGMPIAIDTANFINRSRPERPRLGLLKPLSASAACRTRNALPSRPSSDVPAR